MNAKTQTVKSSDGDGLMDHIIRNTVIGYAGKKSPGICESGIYHTKTCPTLKPVSTGTLSVPWEAVYTLFTRKYIHDVTNIIYMKPCDICCPLVNSYVYTGYYHEFGCPRIRREASKFVTVIPKARADTTDGCPCLKKL